MSLKYRIRLQNQRVIGPFSEEEVAELFIKGHIDGSEQCQQFPIGDWKPLSAFSGLKTLLTKIKEKNLTVTDTPAPEKVMEEATRLKQPERDATKLSKNVVIENTRSGVKIFKEFKFGKDKKIEVDYDELEKKYRELNPDAAPIKDGLEKTRVIRKIPLKRPENIDKTVVVRPNFEKPVEQPRKDKSEIHETRTIKETRPESEQFPKLTDQELANERTEFLNLREVLPNINAQLSASEVELEKQAKIEETNEKKRLREIERQLLLEEAIEEGADEDSVEVIEEYSRENKAFEQKVIIKKKKRGMSVIVGIAFLALFYMFFFEEEAPKVTGPLYLDVKFPITASVENIPNANKALLDARNLYAQNTYLKRAAATESYLISLQNKFRNNEAMGELILAYAELLDNTKERAIAANIIYKFILLSENKMLIDPMTVTGTALFYGKIGKFQTGIYIIKNYLRAGGKPTPKMLSYYLNLLVNAGELVEARKAYEAIVKIPKKPFEAYIELATFNVVDDKPTEARSNIEEGLKYYPNNTALLLKYADLLVKEQSIKKYEEVLLKIKANEAEGSPAYLAEFLEQMGYLSALKNKNKEAVELFKKSLDLKESDELRVTLSALEIGGDQFSQSLILESKVIDLLKKAKQAYKARDLDGAFTFIIEAVDANPDYVPALVFQAQLNTERGFFESAIYSLQRAISINQQNNILRKTLVEVYLKAYKFQDAESILAEIAQTKYSYGPEYASLIGQLAEAQKNPIKALRWLSEALKRDPLSDADMFRMAKILVRNKRFTEARDRLSKAIQLDPKNVEYLALYSEILYEQDGTDTAIGYLRDIISELGEDPILISSIATIYYKSGQLKEFQNFYKKVLAMPKKDQGLYEFLISAAKLEDRQDEIITYSRELLKLNPGNLKVRMDLGETLLGFRRYDEAIAEFNEVKDKLSSYPLVHYYLAKVYLEKNEIPKAREMALKELELNPNLDSAYFIVGEVHRLSKEYREATEKYEKAISLNPKSSAALMAMGWIKLNQNYTAEAIELYSRALKEDPTNPIIHKQMGDSYRAAGQRALAKEKYEDYLKLNPAAVDKDLIESLIKNLQ